MKTQLVLDSYLLSQTLPNDLPLSAAFSCPVTQCQVHFSKPHQHKYRISSLHPKSRII